MRAGDEPFIPGDNAVINGRTAVVAHSEVIEGFFSSHYHMSAVWVDDFTRVQFTDNKYRPGVSVKCVNPRTGSKIRLVQYTESPEKTKETVHV